MSPSEKKMQLGATMEKSFPQLLCVVFGAHAPLVLECMHIHNCFAMVNAICLMHSHRTPKQKIEAVSRADTGKAARGGTVKKDYQILALMSDKVFPAMMNLISKWSINKGVCLLPCAYAMDCVLAQGQGYM